MSSRKRSQCPVSKQIVLLTLVFSMEHFIKDVFLNQTNPLLEFADWKIQSQKLTAHWMGRLSVITHIHFYLFLLQSYCITWMIWSIVHEQYGLPYMILLWHILVTSVSTGETGTMFKISPFEFHTRKSSTLFLTFGKTHILEVWAN